MPKAIIASRIFLPEPAAASFRLAALAEEIHKIGYEVEVVTVSMPKEQKKISRPQNQAVKASYKIRRFPVLRDRAGYVRGYLQYLSFDIPLFFRLLCSKRPAVLILEPPPTTGMVGRVVARLRRIPYVYFVPDLWSRAVASTDSPKIVKRLVKSLETWVVKKAKILLAVNSDTEAGIHELFSSSQVAQVGNGVDTRVFNLEAHVGSVLNENKKEYLKQLREYGLEVGKYFLYSGTVSEWQGADIFIRALGKHKNLKLVFLGQGSAWQSLQSLSEEICPEQVIFLPAVKPELAALWISNAKAALASIKPGSGCQAAFPTKVMASWACGTPVIYTGEGGAQKLLTDQPLGVYLGEYVDYDVKEVSRILGDFTEKEILSKDKEHQQMACKENCTEEMKEPAEPGDSYEKPIAAEASEEKIALAKWAQKHVSLESAMAKAAKEITAHLQRI